MAARLWLLVHRPLWFDEIFTLWASRLPLASLLSALANDSGPPLFYILEKPLVIAGERLFSSDAVVRVLSFAATLTAFAGALWLPSRQARLRFVLLAAASPLLLIYSIEARAYALLSVLVLALFLLAAEARETPGRLAAIALFGAAALYVHYLALFAVGAVAVVAAAEKRPRSALAILAGAVPFLFWIPVMFAQPPEAVAWMHEQPSQLVTGILSSLGGAGRIPPPFGRPLPGALVAIGCAVALLVAFALAQSWRHDGQLRRACAFLIFFFGGVLLASLARPVAFAGRTEMAVLPVWLWVIALAADRSRLARGATSAVATVAAFSTVLLLAEHRGPPPPPGPLEAFERIARPGDALVAGAHFYLPARLEADRGRLNLSLHAFPLEQASHPGWSLSIRIRPEDVASVKELLDRTPASGRVFFQLPPSYAAALRGLLGTRGVVREFVRTPEMVVLGWSRVP